MSETSVVFAAQAGIRELASQRRVITRPIRWGPSDGGAVLRARLADGHAAIEMHERTKVLDALVDLIRRDVRELRELAAGLLTCLATHGVLGRLTIFHAATGQEPRAGEWPAALTHEEHTPARVDARDDRADASRHGVRVGLGATVRPDGNGGSVSDGTTKGVPLGFTVVPGVNAGDGDGDGEGDGVGHGSEPIRFQL